MTPRTVCADCDKPLIHKRSRYCPACRAKRQHKASKAAAKKAKARKPRRSS